MTALPMRPCHGCGQTDDHPRHHHVTPGEAPDELYHMDCHANIGCDVCATQIAGAEGKTGDELRTHLTTKDGA